LFIALQPWGERLADWMGNWIWGLGLALPVTFVPLLFPDGHLPSVRWRPVAWISGLGIGAFVIGSAFAPGRLDGCDCPSINPFGFGGAIGHAVFGAMRPAGLFLSLLMVPLVLASLVFRYRRADGTEREQLRWLIVAGVFIGLGILSSTFIGRFVSNPNIANDIGNAIVSVAATSVPIAIGIGILKYRLYDIDLVLNKTVVYGALAAFITLVYVAIVVGVGSLIGQGGEPNVALSILATAVVAVAFQPVRERVQRFANRLVYGKRATPYEVLAEFSERMAGAYANEDLLPRMARILAEGTGAARADVWLRVDDELQVDASWPADAEPRSAADVSNLPEDVTPVRHQGELLGGLSVEKKPGEAITPTEQKLIDDLASQAGLVLKNVGLTEQLLARLEELKASRQRLVTAQDEERRKLERNIHDGAQQQLVALTVKLRLAEQLVHRDATKAADMLADLQNDSQAALEDLRDLARGIYPPLLADKGLAAALESQARRSPIPVTVVADGIGRFGQDAEAAVYFCCLEALQNIAKYANASRASIALRDGDGRIAFEVTDDGVGFDPAETGYGTGLLGMADRLAALDGSFEVRSAPGEGTRVVGTVPGGKAIS
jgi:signal transduction histidine kinase